VGLSIENLSFFFRSLFHRTFYKLPWNLLIAI
jgi:hypothetical protein